jgi:hypothetical protein
MKNILLIITLFISWNAIAEEKTWFCATEKSGGLTYTDNTWKTVSFKDSRIIVKQNGIKLQFPKDKPELVRMTNCNESMLIGENIISCSTKAGKFVLNPKSGLATSSSALGWLHPDYKDSLSVTLWRCESF